MADQEYPLVGFHFKVDFLLSGVKDGDARFQEVSGINVEIDTETLEEGGENRFVHKLPKRPKYNNLVLKRGLLKDTRLVEWIQDAVENYTFSPCIVEVSLLNAEHEALMTWNFMNAWPVKWSLSDFKATEGSVVIESLELVYQYFTRD